MRTQKVRCPECDRLVWSLCTLGTLKACVACCLHAAAHGPPYEPPAEKNTVPDGKCKQLTLFG